MNTDLSYVAAGRTRVAEGRIFTVTLNAWSAESATAVPCATCMHFQHRATTLPDLGDCKAGWPEEAIQRLLGHSSASMTRRYLDRRGTEIRYMGVVAGITVSR